MPPLSYYILKASTMKFLVLLLFLGLFNSNQSSIRLINAFTPVKIHVLETRNLAGRHHTTNKQYFVVTPNQRNDVSNILLKYRSTDNDEDKSILLKESIGYTDKFNQLLQESLNDPTNGGKNGLRTAVRYLREAIQKQKQHTNNNNDDIDNRINISRKSWDMIFNSIEERTQNAEENTENLRQLKETSESVTFPPESLSRLEMTDMYQVLKDLNQLKLYGAASTNKVPVLSTTTSTFPPPLMMNADTTNRFLPVGGAYDVPPPLLERILGIPMSSLTPKPSNALLWAGAIFAVLEGLISNTFGIPLELLVISTLLFVSIDRLFINGAIIETCFKLLTPGMQQKVTRHEAGHFLIAYLLGCPVEGIVLSAWGALQDKRFYNRAVSAGTSFYDPELSYQMNNMGRQQSSQSSSNKQNGITRSSIDRYSIIVMAGIAAEADHYGRADGGAGDEMALVVFLSQLASNNNLRNWNNNQLNGSSSTSSTQWNTESIRNQARWGAMQAVLLLRYYKPSYDALVDALERGGTLGDCIYAIEKAARDNNLVPIQSPTFGYITKNNNNDEMEYQSISDYQKQQQQQQENVVLNVDNNMNNNILSSSSQNIKKEFNQVEAQKTLEEYRIEVQKKLQDVENRLKELQ